MSKYYYVTNNYTLKLHSFKKIQNMKEIYDLHKKCNVILVCTHA